MAIYKTKLESGEELIIETDDPITDGRRKTPKFIKKILDTDRDLFGEAMNTIELCARRFSATLRGMVDDVKPDEVEASFAIKLQAHAGVVLTKLGGEGQLQVKLIWKSNTEKRV